MKILFISKYYKFLDYFFAQRGSKFDSYDELYSSIIGERYFWSDYFKKELPKYGYEVEQLVIDAKPLQQLWAEEFGAVYSEKDWYFDILFVQICHYKPDILFIQDWSKELGADFIKLVKEKCSNVKTFVGYCGEGHPEPQYFKEHDIIISCAKDNVELFRENGLRAYHIYHAFYPGILEQLNPADQIEINELAFVGRIVATSWAHKERALFLYELAQKIPFSLRGDVVPNYDLDEYHPLVRQLYSKLGWLCELCDRKKLFRTNRLLSSCLNLQSAVKTRNATDYLNNMVEEAPFGLEMYELIRKYKMLLNYHISPRVAANLRLFEVTGMGTCLITDWKENISELFEPDTEIITYRNVDEAVEKISYLLKHPEKRKEIAKAGQKRTLRDHTYQKRSLDMHLIFQDYFNKSPIISNSIKYSFHTFGAF